MLVYALYYTGLLWLYPLPSDAFLVPLITTEKVRMFNEVIEKRGRHAMIGRMMLVLMAALIRNSKNLYRHLRKRGVIVVVWVLNEESEFEEALDYAPEIDGIMTDCPTKLKEFAQR